MGFGVWFEGSSSTSGGGAGSSGIATALGVAASELQAFVHLLRNDVARGFNVTATEVLVSNITIPSAGVLEGRRRGLLALGGTGDDGGGGGGRGGGSGGGRGVGGVTRDGAVTGIDRDLGGVVSGGDVEGAKRGIGRGDGGVPQDGAVNDIGWGVGGVTLEDVTRRMLAEQVLVAGRQCSAELTCVAAAAVLVVIQATQVQRPGVVVTYATKVAAVAAAEERATNALASLNSNPALFFPSTLEILGPGVTAAVVGAVTRQEKRPDVPKPFKDLFDYLPIPPAFFFGGVVVSIMGYFVWWRAGAGIIALYREWQAAGGGWRAALRFAAHKMAFRTVSVGAGCE